MEALNELEQAVLDKLLAGDHPVLLVLRAQAQAARLVSREYTGVGFYCSFAVPSDAPLVVSRDFEISDVNGEVQGLAHGVGFVLFIREGRLDTLEAFSYDEPWPKEFRSFKLTYQREPRQLEFPSVPEGPR